MSYIHLLGNRAFADNAPHTLVLEFMQKMAEEHHMKFHGAVRDRVHKKNGSLVDIYASHLE